MTTAYDVLGVPKGASESEIRSAYRALAKEHHPDVSEHPQAEEVFKQINHAHDILTHERSGYDRWLARRRRPPALRIVVLKGRYYASSTNNTTTSSSITMNYF